MEGTIVLKEKSVKIFLMVSICIAALLIMAGCTKQESTASKEAAPKGGTIKIGLSMDDLRLERWQHDRDLFVAKAKELGAEVVVQSANGDDQTQFSQCENLISQGVNVLVIIPHNGEAMAPIIEQAHKAGIKVLSYDRLITKSDVDYYISFDNIKVGEMQAQSIVNLVPKGNYFLMGGSPTDNNAKMFRAGQMKVLQPLIDKGDIKVIGDQWAKDWLPEEALKIMENGLTANNNKIDAVVASNDSTAGGAIQALAAQGLGGKVPISGQDAELAGCQRIVEGLQTMTVYKPIKILATAAAEVAIKLAKGEAPKSDGIVNNGKVDVPSVLLPPVAVDAKNIVDTVIKDGFNKLEEVYKNVSKDKWPKG
jgi:D-xylose transport system substrate-binding protein